MFTPEITRQKCILVVDDNEDASNSLADILNLLGHRASAIHDGRVAGGAVKSLHPDVVFLDLGMPHMNGYDVALALRQLPGMNFLVIVVLTGWNDNASRTRVASAGFNFHLTKPAPIKVEGGPDQVEQTRLIWFL